MALFYHVYHIVSKKIDPIFTKFGTAIPNETNCIRFEKKNADGGKKICTGIVIKDRKKNKDKLWSTCVHAVYIYTYSI